MGFVDSPLELATGQDGGQVEDGPGGNGDRYPEMKGAFASCEDVLPGE
jgi:hypothetical protein